MNYRLHVRKFTLVELLILVALLCLLFTLLSPALMKTINAARTATCLNNIRQVAGLGIMYSEDNMGFLPRNTTNPSGTVKTWIVRLTPYTDNAAFYGARGATRPKADAGNLLYCPSYSDRSYFCTRGASTVEQKPRYPQGSNEAAPSYSYWNYGSYGINQWALRGGDEPPTPLRRIQQPGRTILFGEAFSDPMFANWQSLYFNPLHSAQAPLARVDGSAQTHPDLPTEPNPPSVYQTNMRQLVNSGAYPLDVVHTWGLYLSCK